MCGLLASPLYTAPRASSTLRGSDAYLPAGNSDLLSWFRLLAWFLNWDFAVHLRKTPKNRVVKSTLIGHHPCPQEGQTRLVPHCSLTSIPTLFSLLALALIGPTAPRQVLPLPSFQAPPASRRDLPTFFVHDCLPVRSADCMFLKYVF
jgi:hypothetical protein